MKHLLLSYNKIIQYFKEKIMSDKKTSNPFKNEELDTFEDSAEQAEVSKEESESVEELPVNNETEKLQAEYDILKSQYVRLMADFENHRKRQEAEKESLLKFGTENALSKMIEVLDNFERAEKALENVDDIEKYKESFGLLHKQVIETLTKLGMEPINAQGQEFDPNFHDAVMRTPTSEYDENTVIAELQKGYKLGDKVLRPSLVNVAAAE